ncbi:MAG: carbohydrate porin [Sulfuriferula sp.]|nr:carbohydrate porin [Sulfuriferula sp.]
MQSNKLKLSVLATLMVLSVNSYADNATLEQKFEQLQKELLSLKQQMADEKSARTQQVAQQVDSAVKAAVADAVPAGSNDTSVGGYGELSYSNYKDGSVKDQIDLNRFVLFFGHKFNDKLRMYSEFEIEHAIASAGDKGEAEIEQAYIEYSLLPKVNLRAGLMLMPLGILNEKHEPPTYYGVFRNEVETRIIPSTWREAGVGLQGYLLDSALEYNVGISSGFDASKYAGSAAYGIKDMHGEASQAAANNLAVYAGLNYRQPGWLLGGGLFTGNTGQDGNGDVPNAALKGVNARLTIMDVHGQYNIGDLALQALYARGMLGDTQAINNAAGIVPGSALDAAPKSFYGWYGQAAYAVWKKDEMRLTPFVRYEKYNTQASVDTGYTANPLNDETVATIGANFNLSREVVLKADWQNYKTDNLKDRFNLGVGWMF